MLEQLYTFLDNQRDLVIELQTQMTARPALCPSAGGIGEIEKAEYLKGWLAANGITDVEEVRAPDDRVPCGYRPTLIARVPGKSSRTVWLLAHTDVVPTGDLALWTNDPWQVQVDGDVLCGRGVEDNQQGIVSSLLTAKALVAQGVTPDFTLGLILVADEETGSKYGLDYIMQTKPELFAKDDLIVVPDVGNADGSMIEVAEKSILWLKVTVRGKQCHASRPALGINSLEAAAEMILKVRSLHDTFPRVDELFEPNISTFTPTKKELNVENVNTVPGLDVFYIDCRVLPGYDLADVRAAIRKLADEVEAFRGVSISLDDVQANQSTDATPADCDVVKRLAVAIREVYNVEARPMGIGGGTVAAHMRVHGLEVACWSTLSGNAHQPDEKSLISININDAKVMTRLLFDK
ncbi:M20 family metallo-hydrolase [Desulfovibrio subterraneus]|uniref:Diaminopimelate aminotransferase n=1 Tax=Desulfovibrio subterraneus TaxID=2718620 RepID=A0A7J0BJ49_9BACT|nr:M20 family metallo-hydrolase [Desulfovibrio subterraneus]GFM33803.1 diaminopimelate aminotransferase [Desulfovibrio subterraneus]